MTDKQIIINGKECRYWFRLNPGDYRKCSLRGKDDNCDEIKDCFVKELLGKLALKEQECEELKKTLAEIKEICNSVENIENINSLYDAKLSGMFLQANKILQKISECEVNNDNK